VKVAAAIVAGFVVAAFGLLFLLCVRIQALTVAITSLECAQAETTDSLRARIYELSQSLELAMGSVREATESQLQGIEKEVRTRFAGERTDREQATERLTAELREALAAVPLAAQAAPELDLRLQHASAEGVSLFREGRYAAARARFERVLREQPANRDARVLHAISLYRENPADSSRYALIESQLAGETSAEAQRVLGTIAMERGQWATARACFQAAAAADPGRAEDARSQGSCSLRLADYAAAARSLDAACSLDGDSAESWHLAGEAHLACGDAAGAADRFARCLRVDPAFAAARLELARALISLDRCAEALEALAPARGSAERAVLVGDARAWLGDGAAARAAWAEAIGLIRENTDADRQRVASLYRRIALSAFESSAHSECIANGREALLRGPDPLVEERMSASLAALAVANRGRR
jgi:tetratricopeptide (TPR) repeat protein